MNDDSQPSTSSLKLNSAQANRFRRQNGGVPAKNHRNQNPKLSKSVSNYEAVRGSTDKCDVTADDLRDEMMNAKRARELALKENSLLHAKLRISEREGKRQEREVERLLGEDQEIAQSTNEYKLRINSLRRKLLEYKRELKEKTEQNRCLLEDRNVAKAAQTRDQLAKSAVECDRLKRHLAQSIPESEFGREKQQYKSIINRLTEENMALRESLGEFEKQYEDIQSAIQHLNLDEALRKEKFRQSALLTKNQASHYRDALNSLMMSRRRSRSVVPNAESGGRKETPASVVRRPPVSASTSDISNNSQHRHPEKPKPNKAVVNVTTRRRSKGLLGSASGAVIHRHHPSDIHHLHLVNRVPIPPPSDQLTGGESVMRLPPSLLNKETALTRSMYRQRSTSTESTPDEKRVIESSPPIQVGESDDNDEYLEMVSNSNESSSYPSTMVGSKPEGLVCESIVEENKKEIPLEEQEGVRTSNASHHKRGLPDGAPVQHLGQTPSYLKSILRSVECHLLRHKMMQIRERNATG